MTAVAEKETTMPTTGELWFVLDENLPWFTKRLFADDPQGVLARRTMIDDCRRLNETDSSKAMDCQARQLVIELLADVDAKRNSRAYSPETAKTFGKIFKELLVGLTPDEAAQRLDGCVPEVEREAAGIESQVQKLGTLLDERSAAVFEQHDATQKRMQKPATDPNGFDGNPPGEPKLVESEGIQFDEQTIRRREDSLAAASKYRVDRMFRRRR